MGDGRFEVQPFAGETLPAIDAYDLLIVMGGPQSPIEIEKAPYLRDEIELIKQALKQHKKIIGVCLGAQLISEALGAATERSPDKEIGIYALELLSPAATDPIFKYFPKQFAAMHWHSDMPGVAAEMQLLAASAGWPRQIFRDGDRVYGFPCHLELTKELVKGMIEHCGVDLQPGKYVMTAEELMALDYLAELK